MITNFDNFLFEKLKRKFNYDIVEDVLSSQNVYIEDLSEFEDFELSEFFNAPRDEDEYASQFIDYKEATE